MSGGHMYMPYLTLAGVGFGSVEIALRSCSWERASCPVFLPWACCHPATRPAPPAPARPARSPPAPIPLADLKKHSEGDLAGWSLFSNSLLPGAPQAAKPCWACWLRTARACLHVLCAELGCMGESIFGPANPSLPCPPASAVHWLTEEQFNFVDGLADQEGAE